MKKIGIAILVIALVVIGGLILWSRHDDNTPGPAGNTSPPTPSAGAQGEKESSTPKERKAPAAKDKSPGQTPPEAERSAKTAESNSVIAYCQKAANDQANDSATKALADEGGLVAILQKEGALNGDPYTCGDYYLAHGGDIDAKDPRADAEHLTPLLFAIKRNDPRMVDYVIDHGADLKQRGGPENVRPYGYAVFLALKNRSTNYNQVIAKLDKALKNAAAKPSGS